MQVRYSQDHQYIIGEDGVGTVGITKYAQEKLRDVTVVRLPHLGEQMQTGDAVGVIEAVNAASDLYSSDKRRNRWRKRNAEGADWIFKIRRADSSELDTAFGSGSLSRLRA
jgi:glycine cleavage system H protein